jgi:hypothetical protein
VSIGGAPQVTAEFPAIIGADLLRSLVPMPDAIDASRRAFTAAARGEVTGPLRSSLSIQSTEVGTTRTASVNPESF